MGRREYLELSDGLLKSKSDGYRRNFVGRGPRAEYCAFWNIYVPRLLSSAGQFVDEVSLLSVRFAWGTEEQTPLDIMLGILLPQHFSYGIGLASLD